MAGMINAISDYLYPAEEQQHAPTQAALIGATPDDAFKKFSIDAVAPTDEIMRERERVDRNVSAFPCEISTVSDVGSQIRDESMPLAPPGSTLSKLHSDDQASSHKLPELVRKLSGQCHRC